MIRSYTFVFMAGVFCFLNLLQADVKSTSSSINFDRNSDGNSEAILNSTGLGIGITPAANLHVSGNALITGGLQVGGSGTFTSNLQVNGTWGFSVSTINSNSILSEQGSSSMMLADNSSGNLFIYFPYAGNVAGRQYCVKNISATYSTVVSSRGSSNIEGLPFVVIKSASGNLATASFMSDGYNWWMTTSIGNILTSGLEWSNAGYSANALWTPAQLTTSTWLDASKASSISFTNGNINTWTDLSAGNYAFTQATGTAQPRWGSANTLNGLNVAVFDGGDSLSATAGPTPGSNNQMMIIVAQLNHDHDGRLYTIGKTSGSRAAIFPNNGSKPNYIHTSTGTNWAQGSPQIAFSTAHIFSGYRNGATQGIGVNAATETTNASATNPTDVDIWQVGHLAGSFRLTGFIAEIVVVSSYDATTYTKIQGYLAWKWGLQSNLPANHTYKNNPPFN